MLSDSEIRQHKQKLGCMMLHVSNGSIVLLCMLWSIHKCVLGQFTSSEGYAAATERFGAAAVEFARETGGFVKLARSDFRVSSIYGKAIGIHTPSTILNCIQEQNLMHIHVFHLSSWLMLFIYLCLYLVSYI